MEWSLVIYRHDKEIHVALIMNMWGQAPDGTPFLTADTRIGLPDGSVHRVGDIQTQLKTRSWMEQALIGRVFQHNGKTWSPGRHQGLWICVETARRRWETETDFSRPHFG